jgi:hypothetical protein
MFLRCFEAQSVRDWHIARAEATTDTKLSTEDLRQRSEQVRERERSFKESRLRGRRV